MSTSSTSGFFYTTASRRQTTKAEQAVLNAGFPWVLTHTLAPATVLHNQHPRSKTIFLLSAGRLKLERGSNSWAGNSVQLLRLGGKRQLTTRANGAFSLTAATGGGQEKTIFVEGQVCLSPEFALRLLSGGALRFYTEDSGTHVNKARVAALLGKMRFQTVAGGKLEIEVPGADTDEVAGALQAWFVEEWAGYREKVRKSTRVVYSDCKEEAETKVKDEGESDLESAVSDSGSEASVDEAKTKADDGDK